MYMVKTLRQRNRKHRKSKKGGSLSLENYNKPGMKQLRTRTRRSSSPKPIRSPITPYMRGRQIMCEQLLRNGIKTRADWEQFLKCKDVNLDAIVAKFPNGESWIAAIEEMRSGRVERQRMRM
jgi:hypothetical protein